ncbi:MAG: helix-turn-helix transcriptional regulator [Firmicutes bacterium]|nr:helix-turn-helix transcriptional regulator [Bacillota bacterium]
MTLGQKITELRKTKGLTQEGLSEIIGVSRQTIANWESDSTNPDINQAKAIAETFQVSLDDLLSMEVEVEAREDRSVLSSLVGRECYLDAETSDYRINYQTPVEVLDVQPNFIKIRFTNRKETIVKLLDKRLINSIKVAVKEGDER